MLLSQGTPRMDLDIAAGVSFEEVSFSGHDVATVDAAVDGTLKLRSASGVWLSGLEGMLEAAFVIDRPEDRQGDGGRDGGRDAVARGGRGGGAKRLGWLKVRARSMAKSGARAGVRARATAGFRVRASSRATSSRP